MEQKRALLSVAYLETGKFIPFLLGKVGYVVDTVHTVDEAWEMVQATKYDIVMAYIFLEDGYGYELLDQVRQSETLVELPFLLLEAFRNTYIPGLPDPMLKEHEYRKDKNYWVIRMPFHPNEFANQVDQIVLRSQARLEGKG